MGTGDAWRERDEERMLVIMQYGMQEEEVHDCKIWWAFGYEKGKPTA